MSDVYASICPKDGWTYHRENSLKVEKSRNSATPIRLQNNNFACFAQNSDFEFLDTK